MSAIRIMDKELKETLYKVAIFVADKKADDAVRVLMLMCGKAAQKNLIDNSPAVPQKQRGTI